jgi:hypothetical protein
MRAAIDISGQQYGMLTAVERLPSKKGRTIWKCLCSCGSEAYVHLSALRSGRQTACGCQRHKPSHLRTHNEHNSLLYRIYYAMRHRCTSPRNQGYRYYGGKGVSVSSEWSTYEPFRDWSRANGYSEGLTIDRLDSDGDYSPSNCEWVTHAENLRRMWERRRGTQL